MMRPANSDLKPSQVKVCGIREPADSAALDALGVDWIGYNFHPGSSRHIAPEAAAPLIRALRHAVPVGVFVDADPDFVIQVTQLTGIRCVQLHGGEDWDYVRRMPVPVIKAIPHTRLHDLGGLRVPLESALRAGEPLSPLAYFLVDTAAGTAASAAGTAASAAGTAGTTTAAAGTVAAAAGTAASTGAAGGFGGSGKTFDWSLLAKHPLPLPLFLAGGLGPHNLADALAACAPFAVDLNSKVETAPGKKDMGKVEACLRILGR